MVIEKAVLDENKTILPEFEFLKLCKIYNNKSLSYFVTLWKLILNKIGK